MYPVGVLILIAAIVVVSSGTREKALIAMVVGAFFLSEGLQINIGINLFAFRFLELAGFVRVLRRNEFSFSRLTRVDRTLIFLYSFTTIVFLIRSREGQAFQVGLAVDAILTYCTFRGLINSMADLEGFLRRLTVLLGIYVFFLMLERYFRYNIFVLVGAAGPGDPEIWDRNGMPRCYGSFRHPSLLGTIGGTFLPIYFAFWLGQAKKQAAIWGMIFCFLFVFASNSGGPLNCVAVGIVGWMLWIVRRKMWMVRLAIVVFITIVGNLMQASIWYLPAKASSLSGGDGWHRSYLMEIAYKNLGNWWFAGMPLEETRYWFPYTNGGTGNADITNYYLGFGFAAGMGAMLAFIWLLTVAFSQLGKAQHRTRTNSNWPRKAEYMLWAFGVMIGIHCINWFGIIYFDQTYVFWLLQIAIIAGLTDEVLEAKPIEVEGEEEAI